MTLPHSPKLALTESGVLRLNRAMPPEVRYQALIENLPDVAIVLFDRDLRMMSVEGGAIDLMPLVADTVIGRRLDEFLGPEHVAIVEPSYRAALAGERSTFDYEATNGVTWWITVVPMYDDLRRISGGMAKWSNVSPRKAAERALQEHALKLERSNAELEQFAYTASHDLSEPLRMVTAYLKLLERRYGEALDDDAQQFIGSAVGGAARMRSLIDDLLAFSRVGQADRAPEAVDVQSLVETIFRTLSAGREGPVPTLRAKGLPVVNGDREQLGQLFGHLLANALKFVAPGRAPVVEVAADPLPDGGWSFTVADEGIGLDPAQAERIFGIFQRLHTRDEFPGTGVGLAIARKVVERHDGRIWAEARRGGGARLRFDLRTATT